MPYYIIFNPTTNYKTYYHLHIQLIDHNRNITTNILTSEDKQEAYTFKSVRKARRCANTLICGSSEILLTVYHGLHTVRYKKGEIKLTIKSGKELKIKYNIKQFLINCLKSLIGT